LRPARPFPSARGTRQSWLWRRRAARVGAPLPARPGLCQSWLWTGGWFRSSGAFCVSRSGLAGPSCRQVAQVGCAGWSFTTNSRHLTTGRGVRPTIRDTREPNPSTGALRLASVSGRASRDAPVRKGNWGGPFLSSKASADPHHGIPAAADERSANSLHPKPGSDPHHGIPAAADERSANSLHPKPALTSTTTHPQVTGAPESRAARLGDCPDA
jgi:hypothetical protein